jgi:hypothetical protein
MAHTEEGKKALNNVKVLFPNQVWWNIWAI